MSDIRGHWHVLLILLMYDTHDRDLVLYSSSRDVEIGDECRSDVRYVNMHMLCRS